MPNVEIVRGDRIPGLRLQNPPSRVIKVPLPLFGSQAEVSGEGGFRGLGQPRTISTFGMTHVMLLRGCYGLTRSMALFVTPFAVAEIPTDTVVKEVLRVLTENLPSLSPGRRTILLTVGTATEVLLLASVTVVLTATGPSSMKPPSTV